jgi:hypothetical protein
MRGRLPVIKSALAIVLVLTAHAHAEGPPPVHLYVTGPIDSAVVAQTLATELERPIAVVSDGDASCGAPCLVVALSGATATVTFATATTTRERTIELGAEHARWPELITLLAGNLVRDDASGLLVEPPGAAPTVVVVPPPLFVDPPAVVAPPALAPVIQLRHTSAPFGIGLVPGLSTDLLDLQRSHAIAIGAVAGAWGDVHGVAVSGAVDVAHDVWGAQIAGAVASANAIAGTQIAGAVAVAAHTAGTQIAGAVTVAGAAHVQIAGAVAAADRADVQVAGAVNTSRRAATQIAGAVNVAGHLTGLQLGTINVASRNDGVQIGVINVAGGPDGESFGLINIVPGGRTDVEASVDDDRLGTVLLRHGSRRWHNIYGIGGEHVDVRTGAPEDDLWMFGFGFGPSLHTGKLPVDLEVMTWHVNHGAGYDTQLSLLNQLRLSVGVALGPVTLVAGGAVNVYVSNDYASPLDEPAAASATHALVDVQGNGDVYVRIWPSVFIGARL